MCERLDEAKALPYETPVHVLTGITLYIVPEFVGPFELIINTESGRQIKSYGATVNDKSTLWRVKNIFLS